MLARGAEYAKELGLTNLTWQQGDVTSLPYKAATFSTRDLMEAASTLGLQLHILNPSTEHDLDPAFASAVQMRAGALAVAADPFYFSQHNPKEASMIVRHSRHEQIAIEEKVSHLAARLGDKQAAVACGAVSGAIAAAGVLLIIGTNRLVRADRGPLRRAAITE
jgi:hypothetical protein